MRNDGVVSGRALIANGGTINLSPAERFEFVRALAIADLINAESVGRLLEITTDQAEQLVAGWKERANKCPECGQVLPDA